VNLILRLFIIFAKIQELYQINIEWKVFAAKQNVVEN